MGSSTYNPSGGGGSAVVVPTRTTVRLASANQVFSIPVANGESQGRIRATGRLIVASAAGPSVAVKINGSATNVVMQECDSTNAAVGAGGARVAVLQNTGAVAVFTLIMHTAKTANGLKRLGQIWISANNGTNTSLTTWVGQFTFNDATTTITTIDLDSGQASGWAANSEAIVEEDAVG